MVRSLLQFDQNKRASGRDSKFKVFTVEYIDWGWEKNVKVVLKYVERVGVDHTR